MQNAVFIYRGDIDSKRKARDSYVVVVSDGVCIDKDGKEIINSIMPND
ncbi:MAG: hypothetical protein ACI8ZF_000361 [Candidatus Midichloriaceae bacterium]